MAKSKCKTCVDNDEDYDTNPYFAGAEQDTDNKGLWLGTASFLVGTAFALMSLNPSIEKGEPVYPPLVQFLDKLDPEIFINYYNLTPLESPLQTEMINLILDPSELSYLETLRSSLETMGILSDPATYPSIENIAFSNAIENMDKLGAYGGQESWKIGQLELYKNAQLQMNVVILIPWETCETKGDCDTEGPVCEDCQDLENDGPYAPEDYPEPPHFGCRCGPGEEVFVVEEFPTNEEESLYLNNKIMAIFIS
jgi:hypothetical protein